MECLRLQTWVTCTTSSVLHVNGNMFSAAFGEQGRSPLSFVCAKLVDVLVPTTGLKLAPGDGNMFTVFWFYGEHRDCSLGGAADCDAHPTGMMSNLVAQLLIQLYAMDQRSLPLDFGLQLSATLTPLLDNANPMGKGGMGRLSIQIVCQLFAELVCSLSEGTVIFCIIDGVSYYEDEDRVEELAEAMSTLTYLANHIHGGRIFKLLTTSPLRFHDVSAFYGEDQIHDMEVKLPPNGGFTAMKWNASLGCQVEK